MTSFTSVTLDGLFAEVLVELGKIRHHRSFVDNFTTYHLTARHNRQNAKFLLSHVECLQNA